MNTEIDIAKKVKQQIASCMFTYGDKPAELMNKLEQLVIEWFIIGTKESNKD